MRALRIGDAFDVAPIASARLGEIVERLKSYEASTIRTGPAYNEDTGVYYVRFYDQGHVFNRKLPQYREPIEITETELYAVQGAFRNAITSQSCSINTKLDEAERRLNDAKDYISEQKAEKERVKQEAAQPYFWAGLPKP